MNTGIKHFIKRTPGLHALAQYLTGGGRNHVLRNIPRGSVGAEIGVDRGDFSATILRHVKPYRLYLVDPWRYRTETVYQASRYGGTDPEAGQSEQDARYQYVCDRFRREHDRGVVQIRRSTAEGGLADLSDNSLDFIYIDGDHLYEAVKSDLEVALRKVRPGGWITGDDYTPGGWWEGGVKAAVDELGWRPEVKLDRIVNRQFVFRKVAGQA